MFITPKGPVSSIIVIIEHGVSISMIKQLMHVFGKEWFSTSSSILLKPFYGSMPSVTQELFNNGADQMVDAKSGNMEMVDHRAPWSGLLSISLNVSRDTSPRTASLICSFHGATSSWLKKRIELGGGGSKDLGPDALEVLLHTIFQTMSPIFYLYVQVS
ncbi:hypothetical protein ARMGADRAFT_1029424 [Armillaria gallica]|uniref:Uncharacterized protein n=1 Tax=Armillaria gallica TaxID=47427 RepID=A0A2H3E163_ARMGA|nr:hypothetical protein ARMGADRAFT_1029424 [Armillaria gallica]